jgi:hypothetical protein
MKAVANVSDSVVKVLQKSSDYFDTEEGFGFDDIQHGVVKGYLRPALGKDWTISSYTGKYIKSREILNAGNILIDVTGAVATVFTWEWKAFSIGLGIITGADVLRQLTFGGWVDGHIPVLMDPQAYTSPDCPSGYCIGP